MPSARPAPASRASTPTSGTRGGATARAAHTARWEPAGISSAGKILATHAETRRYQIADDALVEGIAGQRHAVGADDVGRAASPLADAWSNRNDREVARAAAEVADENTLVVLEPRFVGIGGSDRFVLEHDLLEARKPHRAQESTDGKVVEFRVGRVGEMDRASEHNA